MVLFELVCSLDSDKKKKEKCWSKSLPCPLRLPVTQTTGAEGRIWRETADLTDHIELFSNEFSEKNGK